MEIDSENEWFTAGDRMAGTVQINLMRATAVKTISIGLFCELFASLTRVDDNGHKWTDSETISRNMCEEWKQLFPAKSLTGTQYTLNAGLAKFPFFFTLPRTSKDNNHMLPPSLSDVNDDIIIRYFLKVKIKKPNSLTSSYWKPFIYLPVDPNLDFLPAFATKKTHASKFPKKNTMKSIIGRINRLTQDVTSACDATFTLRCETLLTPAVKFALLISANNKSESSSIHVNEICVTLISRTETTVKNIQKVAEKQLELFHQRQMNIEVPTANDNMAKLISECGLTLPDTVPPTFATNEIKRSYALDAKIGFKCNGSSSTHTSHLVQKVWVCSGVSSEDYGEMLPAYEEYLNVEVPLSRPTRKFPQLRRYYNERSLTWMAAPN